MTNMHNKRNMRAKTCEELEKRAEMIQYLMARGEMCEHCKHCNIRDSENYVCTLRKIVNPEKLCLSFDLYGDPDTMETVDYIKPR